MNKLLLFAFHSIIMCYKLIIITLIPRYKKKLKKNNKMDFLNKIVTKCFYI